jgi:Flp pilus assembly protein TadG
VPTAGRIRAGATISMTPITRLRAARDRGAAAVEFALVLVPLLLLVFGVIDFGRVYNEQVTLTSLAREGARLVSLDAGDAAAVKARLISAAPASLDLQPSQIEVTGCPAPSGIASVDDSATATVVITARYTFSVAALAGFSDASVTVTGKGTMPCTD